MTSVKGQVWSSSRLGTVKKWGLWLLSKQTLILELGE